MADPVKQVASKINKGSGSGAKQVSARPNIAGPKFTPGEVPYTKKK